MISSEKIDKLAPGDNELTDKRDAPLKINYLPAGPGEGLVADDVIIEPEELKAMGSCSGLPVWTSSL